MFKVNVVVLVSLILIWTYFRSNVDCIATCLYKAVHTCGSLNHDMKNW